jgi:hypothetical protein
MIMDVFALHEGLNSIHICRAPRGKHYIDSYLQAFCLNEEDLIRWINENWQAYAYRHIIGMVHQAMPSMLNTKKLRDTISIVDSLYEVESRDNTSSSKLTTMLSSRFKEDSTFSSLLTGKFRK